MQEHLGVETKNICNISVYLLILFAHTQPKLLTQACNHIF